MIFKRNKFTAILLSCVMTASLMSFTGCGGENADHVSDMSADGGREEEISGDDNSGGEEVPETEEIDDISVISEDEDYMIFGTMLSDTWERFYGEWRSFDSLFNYDIDYDNVLTWSAFDGIDVSSVQSIGNNTVIFETKGPDGNPVRFWGYDISVGEHEVTLHKNGMLISLDSVGRIFSIDPLISDPGSEDNWITKFGAYNMNLDAHPDSPDDFVYTAGKDLPTNCCMEIIYPGYDMLDFQPNFFGVGCDMPNGTYLKPSFDGDVVLSDIQIVYEEDDELTLFRNAFLDPGNYGFYLEGERYDEGREVYDPAANDYTFYLWGIPDLKHEKYPFTVEQLMYSVDAGVALYTCNISDGFEFEVLGIRGSDDTVRDRIGSTMSKGDSLVVKVGEQTFDCTPEIVSQYTTAQTMHDLVPYAYPEAKGDMKVLAIPIAWQDEPENATDQNLDEYRSYLGRVADENGNVADYSSGLPAEAYSLSDYFDEVSYGNLSISTFMTDWYEAPYDFSEYRYQNVSIDFFDEVLDWLYDAYPDLDFGSFDRDDNGYFDAVIFLNSGSKRPDGYFTISFEGAIAYRTTYGNEYAGTVDRPRINGAVNINSNQFDNNALIHEFGHVLGLIDYYDVTYSGIDAVGGYDMQCGNNGDWNAYSKYSMGWIEPTIIQGLNAGESVDVEIGVMGETGDMIAVPAAGTSMDDPFTEYMMIDLFEDTGVNTYNAHDGVINIGNKPGVRIYHVDARMEYRDYISYDFPDMEPCPIGTIHFANAYSVNGFYNIELIQSGAVNSFTTRGSGRTYVTDADFFTAGDVFTTEEYKAFFHDGKFDDESDFGYSIEVVSITGSDENAKAVIRITRL